VTRDRRYRWDEEPVGRITARSTETRQPSARPELRFYQRDHRLGRITLENMGPGLAQMRACGDWIEINGPRLTSTSQDQLGGSLDFSGAWMGMAGP
jgi:hypothetical protein